MQQTSETRVGPRTKFWWFSNRWSFSGGTELQDGTLWGSSRPVLLSPVSSLQSQSSQFFTVSVQRFSDKAAKHSRRTWAPEQNTEHIFMNFKWEKGFNDFILWPADINQIRDQLTCEEVQGHVTVGGCWVSKDLIIANWLQLHWVGFRTLDLFWWVHSLEIRPELFSDAD